MFMTFFFMSSLPLLRIALAYLGFFTVLHGRGQDATKARKAVE
jgi:hypothetical protein